MLSSQQLYLKQTNTICSVYLFNNALNILLLMGILEIYRGGGGGGDVAYSLVNCASVPVFGSQFLATPVTVQI